MITHRLSTQPPPEPPVRLYKVIAFSFLILTVVLLGVVVFMTSKKAEVVVVAKEDIEKIQLTVALAAQAAADVLKGMVTSTKFSWIEKYHPTGDKKVEGVAEGEVIIYNTGSTPQQLVKITRLLTANGVLFRLSDGTVVPANGQVTVAVYADKAGVSGDIGTSKFTIPGLAPERQKIVYAESKEPMSGGLRSVGVLSQADLDAAQNDFKEKIKAAYLNKVSARAGEERIVTIADQSAKADHKVGDEVSEFTLNGAATVVAVMYNGDELEDLVTREVGNKIDPTTEKLLSADKPPQVTVSTYDVRAGTAELTVAQEAVVTVDANAPKLAPQNFVGKKKDEIERYVIGFDHVAGVEVKFSPSWMRSAPGVPDRIKVIVKNVR